MSSYSKNCCLKKKGPIVRQAVEVQGHQGSEILTEPNRHNSQLLSSKPHNICNGLVNGGAKGFRAVVLNLIYFVPLKEYTNPHFLRRFISRRE